MTHRVCDDVLVGVEGGSSTSNTLMMMAGECEGWSSDMASRLRRHGGLSAVEAGRAALSESVRVEMLEKLEEMGVIA